MDFHDADSRKDVPFWDFFHIAPHLGVQNSQFWGVNRRFQAKLAKSKNVHIIKTTASIPTKDHQTPFVGGPHRRITNPRWRTATILKKSKNCYISVTVWAILTKFGVWQDKIRVQAS